MNLNRFPQNNREKLVVPRRRYVHILGHIAEANVTFRGKGGTAEHVTDFVFKIGTERSLSRRRRGDPMWSPVLCSAPQTFKILEILISALHFMGVSAAPRTVSLFDITLFEASFASMVAAVPVPLVSFENSSALSEASVYHTFRIEFIATANVLR